MSFIKKILKKVLKYGNIFYLFLVYLFSKISISIFFIFFYKRKKNITSIFQNLSSKSYEKIDDSIKSKLLIEANNLLNEKFNILGIKNDLWPEKVNWHLDVNSGKQWDIKFYKTLNPLSTIDDDYEKKNPWDLSRLQFLFTLYRAYVLTNDYRYVKKIIYFLEDWLKNNPPFFGVNWMNSMEVGIRASNIILIISYLSDHISDELLKKLEKSLFFHFSYIILNKEKYIDPNLAKTRKLIPSYIFKNNHYFFNIIGLIFISFHFDNFLVFDKIRRKSVISFEKELSCQVKDDGVNFEGSIGYNGFFLESFILTTIFLKNKNIFLSEKSISKFRKMLIFSKHYTLPNGKFPVIGDFDSGFLFQLSNRDENSHTDFNFLGAVFLNDINLISKLSDDVEYLQWLINPEKLKLIDINTKISSANSKGFKDGGFYILRNNSDLLILSTSKNMNSGTGGHFHNDALSFELFSGKTSFIVDPGSYVYSSKYWRNLFRSSAYHNSPIIDGYEINKMNSNKLFILEDQCKTELIKWQTSSETDFFSAKHYGYLKLDNPVEVKREILFSKKLRKWDVVDTFEGVGIHEIEWNFHFAPVEIKVDETKSSIIASSSEDKITLTFENILNSKISIKKGWLSSSYGKKIEAPVVNVISMIDLNKNNKVKFKIIAKNF